MRPGERGQRKIVLITGCSTGIGRDAAERLVRAGHTVYATARRAESVQSLEAWADASDGRAAAGRLDVTEHETIESVVRDAQTRFGRIDVLVNNAGYGQIGAVEDVSIDLWRRQLETNLVGAVAMTQSVLPVMRQQRSGRIINVSSVVAHVAMPLVGAYCAS
jgi:NAD(P)-dependent dehydrogenase (short-subunit alcohol dehydrogenase family)